MALVDLFPGLLRDALALAVLARDADTRRVVRLRVEQHHVRDVDRPLLVGHATDLAAALRVADRARALVARGHVQALDEDAVLLRLDGLDRAGLALVLAGDHLDGVALADLETVRHGQSTSGAKEMIFMKLRSRSSRATGPKMRVPRGLLAASMIPAAFSSKAMYVPSSRPNSFLVLTTTAVTTSPFLTLPCGIACLTVATMVSPTPA